MIGCKLSCCSLFHNYLHHTPPQLYLFGCSPTEITGQYKLEVRIDEGVSHKNYTSNPALFIEDLVFPKGRCFFEERRGSLAMDA